MQSFRIMLMKPLLVAAIVVAAMSTVAPQAEAASRAFFVFGDSLVDSGNNNYLATTARADSPPNGVDYPTHRPTGRFSNGLNFPDIVSQALGIEPPLPFLNPQINGRNLLKGANFASAGIGILNDTGIQFVGILRIAQQYALFQQYKQRLSALVGPARAREAVNNAIFLITMGGNDFVNNYFLTPFSPRRRQFNLPDYCRYLISEYRKILKRLNELGARRVLVTGTGALGCVPGQLASSGSRNGECAAEPQRGAQIFNGELFQMLKELNGNVGSDVFIGVNAFAMNMGLVSKPQQYGFTNAKTACCGEGPYNGFGTCNPLSNLCPNRNLYVFWDPYHPTERATRLLVQQMKIGSTELMYPMNLTTVMALNTQK